MAWQPSLAVECISHSLSTWRLKGRSKLRTFWNPVDTLPSHVGLLQANMKYDQEQSALLQRSRLWHSAGEDHAQDQSEVLAALEEALADDVPSSKELIVAADPGATGGSTKSSSTGSANISVIATADMIVRRPRSRCPVFATYQKPALGRNVC